MKQILMGLLTGAVVFLCIRGAVSIVQEVQGYEIVVKEAESE